MTPALSADRKRHASENYAIAQLLAQAGGGNDAIGCHLGDNTVDCVSF